MTEQYLPDTFGGMTGAFNAGRLIAGQRAAAQKQQQLSALAPAALQGDPNATAQAYALDPDTAKQYGDGAARIGLQLHNLANQIKQMHASGNEQGAAMLYQQAAPMIRQKFPNAPAQWDPNTLMPAIDAVVAMTAQPADGKLPSSYEEYQLAQSNPGFGEFLNGRQPTQLTSIPVPGGSMTVQWNPRTKQMSDLQGNPVDAQGNPVGQASQPQGTPQGTPASDPGAGINDPLSQAVMQQESGGDPNAVSPAGARGLMQIMPDTAKDPGFGIAPMRDGSPQENVRVGQDYLHAMLQKYNGDQQLALAAYNGGPGRIDAALKAAGGDKTRAMAMLPKETQQYPGAVQARMGGQTPVSPMAGRPGFKPDKVEPSVIGKRMQELQDLRGAGQQFTEADASAYLKDGKFPEAEAQAPGDPSKTGDDYLATLPPQAANQVKALAEGRMQFPSGTALKSAYWQGMLSAVSQFDPNFDAVNYNARSSTRKAFTSGKEAQTVNALNTVAEHLGKFSDNAAALHNTGFPIYNRIKNFALAESGDPRIAAFNTNKKAVADEIAKVWRATGGSEADIQENLRNLDGAQSPEQLNAAIGTLTQLIYGKVSALQDQYASGMGTTQTPRPLVSKDAQAAFDKTLQRMNGNDAPATPAQRGPAVGTIEDGHRFKGGNPADPASWEAVR